MRASPSLRSIGIAILLLTLMPATARAEWFTTPFLGIKFGGRTSIVDLEQAADQTTLALGVSVARLDDGILGAEIEFAYIPGYFERENTPDPLVSSSYVFDLSGNLILALPSDMTGGGLRPYFTAGFGLLHAEGVDIRSVVRIRRSMPALTLGAGATGILTNRLGARFDVRYLRSIAQEDEFVIGVGRQLSYWRGTIGIGIRY
jgi:opacity protein-like surface antigen